MTIPVGVNNYAQSVGTASDSFLLTYFATVNPTPQTTQFPVQKRWINTLTSTEFILSNFTSTGGYIQANWVQLTAGVTTTETLTGNSGGNVSPTAGNINVQGDGTTINIVGNPGTSTLTANVILPGTANQVLIGEISSISGISLTNGQLVIGGTSPAAATLTAGSGIDIVNGNNSITISSTSTGVAWDDITTSPKAMDPDTAYTSNSASLINFVLPVSAAYGTVYEVVGKGTGLWTITYNSGQIIHYGDINTTPTTGSISSSNQYDSVFLVCTETDTDFTVTNTLGNLTHV